MRSSPFLLFLEKAGSQMSRGQVHADELCCLGPAGGICIVVLAPKERASELEGTLVETGPAAQLDAAPLATPLLPPVRLGLRYCGCIPFWGHPHCTFLFQTVAQLPSETPDMLDVLRRMQSRALHMTTWVIFGTF